VSHAHSHENTVPPAALAMAFALVGVSLLMTAAVQLGWADREAVPAVARAQADVAKLETRNLTFADMADGSVQVTDADTREVVASFAGEADGGGFIRGVLRGLARDRRMRGIDSAPPFALTMWEDGSLSLVDAATGRSIELGSFGPDNRATFARLLRGSAQ
jgi:putative photosynthetic complex assembly protein